MARLATVLVLLAALAAGGTPAFAAPVPTATVGAPIGDPDGPGSLFRPATFRATFRVPRSDTALYIGTQWFVRDVEVTLVGPGNRRQTIAGDTSLPGHMLGLRLPADAWQADRVELRATAVSAADPPYLLRAEKLGYIAWRNWWWSAFFGLFVGLAVVQGLLALVMRSRAFGWFSLAMLMEALLTIANLGIVRPPPEFSQPLNAVVESVQFVALLLFSLAYLHRARVGRAARVALWIVVALNVVGSFGSDVFQDSWPVPDIVTRLLIAAMGFGFVLLGVAGLRRKVEGAAFYLAGTICSVIGLVIATYDGPLYLPFVQSAPMIGAGAEALLLALALSLQLRRQERERAHLDRLARIDGLTGIANRAVLEERLAHGWESARRAKRPLAALMIDVDHFKQYNDTYGHQAGDEVLRRVARVLAELPLRADDVAARYGGEEFLVLLCESDLAGAQGVADRALAAIGALDIAHENAPAGRVSVSIGVASVVPGEGDTADGLIRRADAALYAAKAQGRNRLVLADAVPA